MSTPHNGIRGGSIQGGLGWRLEIAIFSVGAALGLNLLLRLWLPVPYWFLFLVAGIASAWMAGRVAGWTAVVLSTLACDYFFDQPYYSFAVAREELPEFIAFAASMIAGNWFGNWRRNTEKALHDAREALTSQVEAGGAALEKVSEALRTEVGHREQAEHDRHLAELRWRAVFDNATVGIALADEHGGIISANHRFLKLVGRDGHTPNGGGLADLIAGADAIDFRAEFAALFAGGRERIDREVRREDDSGSTWLRIQIALVPGRPEFPRFMIVFCEDISQHKRAAEALITARAELAHASRLTTIGELTASIAHELNQPLAAVVTNGNACLRWLGSDTPNLREARNTINWIMRDAKRASDVISRIRTLMRKGEPRWDPVNFNQIISESLELVQSELARKQIEVSLALDPQLMPIRGERIQLQQVFLNLVINAIEAMATVTDRRRRLHIQSRQRFGTHPGIVIEVRDNGPGIALADMDRLFTAFYTTKPEGTGLGLWISHSIIEHHSGRLIPVPDPDQGLSLLIELPNQSSPQPLAESIAGEDFSA
jgi:PAS domain S-box-containing protein